ncbi:sugar phosphate nucleotidyltransferase [Limisalsivibrio acetivorans]|uniref:sugar phosphate nucleotidyltransferase n=1 Tax=Limisalsivibrio acetivorans TaxID=1304888 RepID=UPI0003B3EE18|nr:sugar phosphate nucleotidyltransferase [Limisalsivibrio acetivorans]
MKAVVMAGGFGTRIQPLTSSVPKPMIPVMNKPMMEYIIESLKEAGIVDIVILLYFKPEIIKEYFGDGSDRGVNITYVLPDDDYGTAGAVKQAEEFLDEKFIIVSGDLITDFSIQEIIGYHDVKNSKATITLTSVPDPLQFGVVITDKDGQIVRFLEKPGWGEVFSDTINTGIYVFEPEVLKYIPDNANFDFSKDLFPKLMSAGINIYGYNAKGYWRDVGNPDSYRAALHEIINGEVELNYDGELAEKDGARVFLGKDVQIDDTASFEGLVILGDGCRVGKDAKLSNMVAGKNCVIGAETSIEDSILWDEVKTGEKCSLKNVVLCNHVLLGKKVMGESGCIIAQDTEVGNYVIFEKDVMVWPNKQIEESSIVSSNLIWGDKWKKSIFEGGKVSARTNVEMSPELAAKLGSALGSQLPAGSRVLLSRDYHRGSRMLKRCFLGGLLSTGVNVTDIRMSPLPVMCHKLSMFGEVAGVYFRQSQSDSTHTEVLFFDEHGTPIDSGMEKSVERIFFRENFRRAAHEEIGEIYEQHMVKDFYRESFLKTLDVNHIRARRFQLVVDLMNGTTENIYPDLLNRMGAESVILNSYQDEMKLSKTIHQHESSLKEVSDIVKVKEADLGLIIYPHGEKISIITDKGRALRGDFALMMFIKLIDLTIKEKVKVYLPAYSPTVLDSELKNVEIVRGKVTGLKVGYMRNFYFFGNLQHNYIFLDNGIHADAMYCSVKLLEMLARLNLGISEVLKLVPDYYFVHNVINCPLELKGFLMRKMSEEAMDRDASFLDGIKIIFEDRGWVHMVPDQYSPNVHVYVEAMDEETGKALQEEYKEKIHSWLENQE